MKLLGDFEVIIKRKGESNEACFTMQELDERTTLELSAKQKELIKENRSKESMELHYESLLNNLVSVKGMQNLDGTEMTLEQFKQASLPFFFKVALVRGYNEAQAKLYDYGDLEKK